jgi:hypothetical protein
VLVRRGVGDFSDPACTPGEKGCVPHWYCYIPGMATPDCLQSFVTGTGELAQTVGSTVGRATAAAATGATGGLFSGLLNPNAGCDSSDWWCNYGSFVLIAGGLVAVFVANQSGRRRR